MGYLYNKKGSDKPIEIFVSLFLILAVAMVLLKLFSGQVAEKRNELAQYSQKQQAFDACEQACSETKTNKCRPEDQVKFCTEYFKLDLDDNSEIGTNNNFPFTICEDRIYCPIVTQCTCGVKLNMKNCKNIVINYYKNLGLDTDSINKIFHKKFKYTDGACNSTPPSDSWYDLFHYNEDVK